MEVIKISIKIIVLILVGILFISCEIPATFAFPAYLNVRNAYDRTIYITPIGVDSNKEHRLLPVLERKFRTEKNINIWCYWTNA